MNFQKIERWNTTYQWKNRETILACNKGLGLFDFDDISIKVLPVLYFFALDVFSPQTMLIGFTI